MVEPFNDFRISLIGRKSFTENYQEIFRNDMDSDIFISINPNRTGTYNVSQIMIKTAFSKDDNKNNSPLFNDFEKFRGIIKNRLDAANNEGEYDINSQEVVIAAFRAAYRGVDPNEVEFSPFPNFPIPNWSLNYRGLSNITSVKEVFSSINISHSYTSQYSVSNFVNSPLYTIGLTLDNSINDFGLASERNENNVLVPIFLTQQVVMTESLSPLIGLNMRTNNNWDIDLNYSRERNIGLNLNNIQVTEQTSKSFQLRVGFAASGITIPFRVNGRKERLPNELRFNMTLTINDGKTVQRRIDEDPIITDGIRVFKLSPTVDYNVSQALQLSLYYDRNANDPKVSTSFLNARSSVGVRIRFSLAQ